jgi:hypothetical protein
LEIGQRVKGNPSAREFLPESFILTRDRIKLRLIKPTLTIKLRNTHFAEYVHEFIVINNKGSGTHLFQYLSRSS